MTQPRREQADAPAAASRSAGCTTDRPLTPPAFGVPVDVAPGIWWIRLPLAGPLGHVNVYVLDDGESWTLVDTGCNTAACRWALKLAFSQWPLRTKPLSRVVATHFHPDHMGLAGELVDRGATLWTTRTTWLTSHLLRLDQGHGPGEALVKFARKAGLVGDQVVAVAARTVADYPRLVTTPPATFHHVADGDALIIGTRRWVVTTCDGHAAEHAMLWSDDGLVLAGDQVIRGLSPRVAVPPSEPDADPVGSWLAGMQRIAARGDDDSLALPGHHAPFVGVATRCRQILASYDALLSRLLDLLSQPITAAACLEPIHRRPVAADEALPLVAEMVGYLNYLAARGHVQRIVGAGDAHLWRRTGLRRAAASPPLATGARPIIAPALTTPPISGSRSASVAQEAMR